MRKILISALLLVVSASTFAEGSNTNKTISSTHVNIGSGYYFKTSENMLDADGCGSAAWYKLSSGTYSKEAFSLILSAQISGQKVDFYLKGCASGYPEVSWINVHN